MSQCATISRSAKRGANKKAREATEAENAATPVLEMVQFAEAKAKAENLKAPELQAQAPIHPNVALVAKRPPPRVGAVTAPKPKAKEKAAPATRHGMVAVPTKVAASSQAHAKSSAMDIGPQPSEELTDIGQPFGVDDGKGGDWEVCTGMSKKQQARRERLEQSKKMAAAAKAQGWAGKKHIGGITPAHATLGLAPSPKEPAVSQSVNMTGAAVAAHIKTEAAATVATAKAAPHAPKFPLSTASMKAPDKQIGIAFNRESRKPKPIQDKRGGTHIDTCAEMLAITNPPEERATSQQAVHDRDAQKYAARPLEDAQEKIAVENWTTVKNRKTPKPKLPHSRPVTEIKNTGNNQQGPAVSQNVNLTGAAKPKAEAKSKGIEVCVKAKSVVKKSPPGQQSLQK